MGWRAELGREVRRLEAAENASLAGFDPWAAVAGVVRCELERRAEVRAAAEALSGDAWRIVRALHAAGGTGFLKDLPGPIAALRELQEAGLLVVAWAYDEQGHAAELVALLVDDVEIPGS